MKFQIEEKSIDADYNVTINGYYNDNDVQVGEKVAFQFNLDGTPHSSASEFLGACKARIEQAQPVISEEELAKKALAEQASALLDAYVGQNITLNPLT